MKKNAISERATFEYMPQKPSQKCASVKRGGVCGSERLAKEATKSGGITQEAWTISPSCREIATLRGFSTKPGAQLAMTLIFCSLGAFLVVDVEIGWNAGCSNKKRISIFLKQFCFNFIQCNGTITRVLTTLMMGKRHQLVSPVENTGRNADTSGKHWRQRGHQRRIRHSHMRSRYQLVLFLLMPEPHLMAVQYRYFYVC